MGVKWKKNRRWVLYGLMLFLLYLISTAYRSPLRLFGVRPMLFIPVLTCLAVVEDERFAALAGAFSGLLLDSTGTLFFGFYTLQLTFIPYFIAVLCCFLLRKTQLTAFFVTLLWMLLFELIYYAVTFFTGGGDMAFAFTHFIAPRILYSSVFVLLFYPLFLRMRRRFLPKNEM